MKWTLVALLCLPIMTVAAPILTITPVSNTLTVDKGTTAVESFEVKNTSGAALTITSETAQVASGVTTDTVNTSETSCTNQSLAATGNGRYCDLEINVTGNTLGTDTLQPVVCAFNGQLCVRPAQRVTVTVDAANTYNCSKSGTNRFCRMFVTAGTYLGDLSQSTGTANVSTCENNMASVTRGNCICEREAALAGLGNAGHWRAWLSRRATDNFSSEIEAKNNIGYNTDTGYTQKNGDTTAGNLVANNTTNPLVSTTINVAPAVEILLNAIANTGGSTRFWTGTAVTGKNDTGAVSSNCLAFTSAATAQPSLIGVTTGDIVIPAAKTFAWTGSSSGGSNLAFCHAQQALLCIER